MTDPLILHQYEISPFSEKIRRILAWKGLPWTAVRAPAVMPKPDLLALTGGYRKIPVLQVGNHVYCDSALIANELERRCPAPSLYMHPLAASLAEWADTRLFEASIPLIMRPTHLDDLLRGLTQDELQRMADDRRAMRADTARVAESSKALRAHFQFYLARVEATLTDKPCVLGDLLTIADFSVYHVLWLVARVHPDALAAAPHTRTFLERMEAIADPVISTMTPVEALALAKNSPSDWQPEAAWQDPTGFNPGQAVRVRATDYGRDPVEGELVYAAVNELVLRRRDARAGVVYVHFPRIGFELAAA